MRTTRWVTATTTAAVVLPLFAGPAHADDQSYLNYLKAHGFQYHTNVENPDRALAFGHHICTSLQTTGDPIARIDPKIADSVDNVMIDGAQHELCPDTLHTP